MARASLCGVHSAEGKVRVEFISIQASGAGMATAVCCVDEWKERDERA